MDKFKSFLLVLPLLTLVLVACGQTQQQAQTPPTPNTQATVEAAVAATQMAEVAVEATINAAVNATASAQAQQNQAQIEQAVQATVVAENATQATLDAAVAATVVPQQPMPESTPVPVDVYTTMSEEELAYLIEVAVYEAMLTSQQYSAAATYSTSDSDVSYEELAAVATYYDEAYLALMYAEELLGAYYGLYADVAYEMVDVLYDIEDDLEDIEQAIYTLNDTMVMIEQDLAAGLALAEETITQVQNTSQMLYENATVLQTKAEAWQSGYHVGHDNLTELGEIAGPITMAQLQQQVPANQIYDDPVAALQTTLEFAQTGQSALSDNQITPAELGNLAQLGANAAASLDATGQPNFQQLSGQVNNIALNMANSNLPQAQTDLSGLNGSLTQVLTQVPATQISDNPVDALQAAIQFAQAGQSALGDNQITPAELGNLAQLGANANASLNATGRPNFQQMSGQVNNITMNMASNNLPQAQADLSGLSLSIDGLRSAPDLGGVQLPEIPQVGGGDGLSLPDPPSLPQPGGNRDGVSRPR